jgi:hypothetical protein
MKPVYISQKDALAQSVRWNRWQDKPYTTDIVGASTVPMTLFPYASGSYYMGTAVERSNYRVIQDQLPADCLVDISGVHDTYGVAFLGTLESPMMIVAGELVDADEDTATAIREVVDSLENYPLLNESDHSELEAELEVEAWNDWGARDFERALESEFGIDEIDPKVRDATWWAFSSQGSGSMVVEEGCSVHFNINECTQWLRKDRYLGSGDSVILVLGHVDWSDRHTLEVARDAALEGRMEACHKVLAELPGVTLVDLEEIDD